MQFLTSKLYYKLLLCYLFFIGSVIFFATGFFNVRFFTTTTTSMVPTITPSSLLIVTQEQFYNKGDIISFYAQKSNQTITHRIYSIGGNVYITKGDANITFDSEKVTPQRIIGKVVGIIPLLGIWFRFIKSGLGTFLFIVLPTISIIAIELYKINFLIKPAKKNRRTI